MAETYPEANRLLVSEAQRECRAVYAGGFFGQFVSGLLWLASAALGSWASPRAAIRLLILGGFFIFPLVGAILRLLGRPASLSPQNPLRHLGMQVAFVLPLSMPLVAPATTMHLNWFFPSMMVLLGAHYLPFTFLYGMRCFIPLSAVLVTAGLVVGLWFPDTFSLGGWLTGASLLAFAFIGRAEAARDAS